MKISQAAKYSGLSVIAIRYYISLGLLIPKKINTKFHFTNDNVETLKFIFNLKKMGLSVNDIQEIIALKRISNWVEPEDLQDYGAILQKHRDKLTQSINETQIQIKAIDDEFFKITESYRKLECSSTGIPLKTLEYFCCPTCKTPLTFTNSQMSYKYVYNSMMTCSKCSYQAQIIDGIVYTKSNTPSEYDKPDIGRSIYKDIPKEIVTLFQKTYNWMLSEIDQSDQGKIIMETHLNSFFFLYRHFKSLNGNNVYIVVDKFSEIITMFKKNIEYLNLDLDIIYIVNNDNILPLKENLIDYFIDYGGSNEQNIFSSTQLIPSLKHHIKKDGQVIGTYFSFDQNAKSHKKLKSMYRENYDMNYCFDHYKSLLESNQFKVIKHSREGIAKYTGPGTAFVFHVDGENLYMDCVLLKKTE